MQSKSIESTSSLPKVLSQSRDTQPCYAAPPDSNLSTPTVILSRDSTQFFAPHPQSKFSSTAHESMGYHFGRRGILTPNGPFRMSQIMTLSTDPSSQPTQNNPHQDGHIHYADTSVNTERDAMSPTTLLRVPCNNFKSSKWIRTLIQTSQKYTYSQRMDNNLVHNTTLNASRATHRHSFMMQIIDAKKIVQSFPLKKCHSHLVSSQHFNKGNQYHNEYVTSLILSWPKAQSQSI